MRNPAPTIVTDAEARRRVQANKRIEEMTRCAARAEAEGRYRDAQDYTDAAADWEFWATWGVTPEQWDAANPA